MRQTFTVCGRDGDPAAITHRTAEAAVGRHRAVRGIGVLSAALLASLAATVPAHGSMGVDMERLGSVQGVSGASANDAWAVGSFWTGSRTSTLAQHWDGSHWTKVASPSPGTHASLTGVSMVSADDAWAVGTWGTDDPDVNKTLAVHWDGTSWATVPTPSPRNQYAALLAVSGVSATDVWAVGVHYGYHDADTTSLIEHWDGSTWSVVPGPGSDSNLFAVSARSATDVWAAGRLHGSTLVVHWDGSAWTQVPTPSPGTGADLRGISAVSVDDVWAVGLAFVGDKTQTLVEHWDGSSWTQVAAPSPGPEASLVGVSAVSDDDAWAVGHYRYGAQPLSHTLIAHWDGTSWTEVHTPAVATPENAALLGVSAVSASHAWIAGATYDDDSAAHTLVRSWDGKRWTGR